MSAPSSPLDELLDTTQAAAYLRVANQTIRNWTSKKKLTVHKLGRTPYYDPADLNRMIKKVEATN